MTVLKVRRTPIRTDAIVEALNDEGGANWRLVLSMPEWPGCEPGQFVMLSPGARESVPRTDPLLPRPMAVFVCGTLENPERRFIEILFKVHGRGTALLAGLARGSRVGVVGPLGSFFPDPPPGERALIVAGGTGIASVYNLAFRLREQGVSVKVLLGARTAVDLMGEGDFVEAGLDLAVATEDGSRGTRGIVTDLLVADLASRGRACVYACGPTPMMAAAARIAEQHGCDCWASLENPMACGFGVCLGCAAPLRDGGFALVCRDGPVLPAETVAWESMR